MGLLFWYIQNNLNLSCTLVIWLSLWVPCQNDVLNIYNKIYRIKKESNYIKTTGQVHKFVHIER